MATDTSERVRSLVLYQVFPRNHGATGRLVDVTADLDRIRALGVDVVYLMPIHPIGVVGRKGSLGSPYAISDYRALNPDLATDAEFDQFVAAAHDRGMLVMIDVVFNHTSRDSVLVGEHPEFFHRDAKGQPVTTVPAWTDIIDLAHPEPELARYLIDSLAIWVRRGVDGFRCDVASLVPVAFWQQARAELAELNPALLWLAESPHPTWVAQRRRLGLPAWSDAELFAAFDMEYEYDMWSIWQAVVTGREPAWRYVEMLRVQDAMLPGNSAKLRFVENHDQYRIMRFAPSREQALAWTAFASFNNGPLMFYAGQESGATKWPSLFDPDPVSWGQRELSPFLGACAALKKRPEVVGGTLWLTGAEPVISGIWGHRLADRPGAEVVGSGLLGLFNVEGQAGDVAVPIDDGQYLDLLGGPDVVVRSGRTSIPRSAAVVAFTQEVTPKLLTSNLLDLFLHVEELGDD